MAEEQSVECELQTIKGSALSCIPRIHTYLLCQPKDPDEALCKRFSQGVLQLLEDLNHCCWTGELAKSLSSGVDNDPLLLHGGDNGMN